MLTQLDETAKKYLITIFNRFWQAAYIPKQWRHAIIIPIPKPGKPHDIAENYRPISLTSCICKTMERIVNTRLSEYLQMHNVISRYQCGCRKNRSTVDHLVRLETQIRTAFARGEHFVSVFYDLEKAYDRTWRYGILRDLHSAGLRGRLPMFIESFMRARTMSVRIGEWNSEEKTLQNGVPQGSVLAVTLFALKINNILSVIPSDPNFHVSLYVDDLQIGYHHTDINIIQEKMQNCLDNVHKWATKQGFTFSPSKSKAVHFNSLPMVISPVLTLNGIQLEYCNTIKFLGLIWDCKLAWKAHVAQLKAKCSKTVSLLRSLTTNDWGADQQSLMILYRMLLRSKIEYGYIVYSSAAADVLRPLHSIISEALRIASGAFKSTPIQSLHIITNEMPTDLRIEHLTLKYFFKVRSQLNNPAIRAAVIPSNRMLFRNKNMTPTFAIRAQEVIENLNIRTKGVKPEFSYNLLGISTPNWAIDTPEVNTELIACIHSTTSKQEAKQVFEYVMEDYPNDSIRIYTDGSKGENGVGAAAVSGNTVRSASLLKESSIYSAEAYAIQLALHMCEQLAGRYFVVCSDSLGVLQSLSNRKEHPMIQKLAHGVQTLRESNKYVKFCWVPGHMGIWGNEMADAAAKQAAGRKEEFIPIYYRDWDNTIAENLRAKWKTRWGVSANKLRYLGSLERLKL